jgi:uncharacterized protein (DUF433 family)
MRVTVGTIIGLVASATHLEDEDIRQALAHAAWRVDKIEVPLPAA